MSVNLSTAVVTIAGVTYEPSSFEITADNNWTPTWSGTVVFPRKTAPVLDPTTYPVVRVDWWYGNPETTVPNILSVLLYARSRVLDDIENTVTISLASAEILLQDQKYAATNDYQPGAMDVVDMYKFAINRVGIAYSPIWLPLPASIPAASTVWKVGQDLDSWLRPAMRSKGWDIYQDMPASLLAGAPVMGAWLIDNGYKESLGSAGYANAIYGKNIIEARFGTDMDAQNPWADAATAVYSWVDSGGLSRRKAYRTVPAGGTYRKTLAVAFDAADPGFDPTSSILAIAQRCSLTGQIVTTPGPAFDGATPAATMRHGLGEVLGVQLSDGSLYQTTAARIEWSYPDDRITFGLEQIQSTTALQPLPLP